MTGVSVSPFTLSVMVGQTGQLTKTITPAGATNQNVGWISSNPSVATVSGTGLVTAVATGTATITATSIDGGFRKTSTVTVNASGGATYYSTRLAGTVTEIPGILEVGGSWRMYTAITLDVLAGLVRQRSAP